MGIPVGTASRWSAPYWDACRESRLSYQRCGDCEHINVRPAPICGACHRRNLAWATSRGAGSLASWTVVWRPQHPAFTIPYVPAIVHLDEGFHLVSSIVGCEPDEITSGMRLFVAFHAASDDIVLPYFRPAA
jgi:uncharacterized OB-fold protein